MVQKLIRFFGLGPQRSGSTWLDVCLRQHPQCALPVKTKETFFFDRYFDRGLCWYERQFDVGREVRAVGEVAPSYFGYPDAPIRIAQLFPEARLIVTLRNPIERAWSHFLHLWRKGDVSENFDEAIHLCPEILERGLYYQHISVYDRYFADSNMLCLKYETIHNDPAAHIDRLLRFIKVATEFHPQSLHSIVNASEVPRSRLLSACATLVSRKLHAIGLHDIVNVAKTLGFYRMVYHSGVRPPLQMTLDQRNRVRNYYESDVRLLSGRLNEDFGSAWFSDTDSSRGSAPLMPQDSPSGSTLTLAARDRRRR